MYMGIFFTTTKKQTNNARTHCNSPPHTPHRREFKSSALASRLFAKPGGAPAHIAHNITSIYMRAYAHTSHFGRYYKPIDGDICANANW